MDDDGDFIDDWLIKSLKSYTHLHMFELSQPTCVIEWSGRNGVCVAGCSDDIRNEILEMRLPAKLMTSKAAGTTANLTKDRDFKMLRGGFSDRPIHCLGYLRGTSPRLIVTGSHKSRDLDVWQLDTESGDVIKKVSTVSGREAGGRGGVRGVAQRPGHPGQVAFGSALCDMQILDVETKDSIATDFGEVDSVVQLQFLNENELVTCNTETGLINIHDLRTTFNQSETRKQLMNVSEPESKPCALVKDTKPEVYATSQSDEGLETTNRDSPNKGEVSWTFDLNLSAYDSPDGEDTACKKPKLDVAMATAVRLCSNDNIIVNDLRNLQTPLHSVQLAEGKMPQLKSESLTVKWCPTERNLISVSGLNGCVSIYDISTWPQLSTPPPIVQPIFTHEGHMMAESTNQKAGILCHTWHPQQPRVIISSGSDGSLHAWDWSSVS